MASRRLPGRPHQAASRQPLDRFRGERAQALEAARGRPRGRLEAVLEAVPRVRCKLQGFHENSTILEFSIFETPFSKGN